VQATDFKRASHAVWEAMAPGWAERHAYIEEAARPVTERMLERLAPEPGQTVLDLAAGTGIVGFAAAALVGPRGRVIVSDFSKAMLRAAQRRAARLTNVECRLLDAEQLALPDQTIDGVLCRWGYMLIASPDAALAEARRVLRRDGRLCCAVFAGPEQNPWAALPLSVLEERGHMLPPHPDAPGVFALADRGRLSRAFVAAGFRAPQIDEVPFSWRFRNSDDYWTFLIAAAGAIATVLARIEDKERERVRKQIATRASRFSSDRGIELPALSLVATA
jgi:SAM-dependent methyltransferase